MMMEVRMRWIMMVEIKYDDGNHNQVDDGKANYYAYGDAAQVDGVANNANDTCSRGR